MRHRAGDLKRERPALEWKTVGEGRNVGFRVCTDARYCCSSTQKSSTKERPDVSKQGAEQCLKLEEAWGGQDTSKIQTIGWHGANCSKSTSASVERLGHGLRGPLF